MFGGSQSTSSKIQVAFSATGVAGRVGWIAADGACVAPSLVACKRVDKRGDAGARVVRHPTGAHLSVGFRAGADRRASRAVQLLLGGRVRSWGVLSEFARDRDRPRDEVGGR